jgi:DNA-binding GntR family transcriptional regulator
MNRLPQLKAVSMRESVGEVIRKALYERRFDAGESLSEARLAAEMGISRGPVREALLVLVQEGLLTHSPNRGFFVVNFTQNDHKEINEIRLPLESTALTLAKPNVSAADVRELQDLKNRMVESYAAGELVTCSQADMAFHSLIWDRTLNSRLATTLRTLLASFFAYGSLFSVGRPELSPRLLDEEHAYFIQFLRGTGKRTAEDCVRFHLGM